MICNCILNFTVVAITGVFAPGEALVTGSLMVKASK